MFIKQIPLLAVILFSVGVARISSAEDETVSRGEMMHHDLKHSMNDGRISLGLPPEMREHQLKNMRAHLVAVQAIVGLIGEQKFEEASQIARTKLGLTEEMQKMCNLFPDNDFRELGLAFHKSGDDLANVLKTKNMKESLRALHNTLGYCTQCHAAFRQ
jgi:cytochrome c556